MATFNGSILVGRISTGELDGVTELLEKCNDTSTAAKFTTLIKTKSFVLHVGTEPSKPLIEVGQWGAFIDEDFAMNHATEVVGDEYVTGFTFETNVVNETVRVLRLLDDESHVNGKGLMALSSFTRDESARRIFDVIQTGQLSRSVGVDKVGMPSACLWRSTTVRG